MLRSIALLLCLCGACFGQEVRIDWENAHTLALEGVKISPEPSNLNTDMRLVKYNQHLNLEYQKFMVWEVVDEKTVIIYQTGNPSLHFAVVNCDTKDLAVNEYVKLAGMVKIGEPRSFNGGSKIRTLYLTRQAINEPVPPPPSKVSQGGKHASPKGPLTEEQRRAIRAANRQKKKK